MSLASVLAQASDIQSIYAVHISATKLLKFWNPNPTSPSLQYEVSYPFDGSAYITNVFYNGTQLTLATSSSLSQNQYFWDRTNLFVRLSANADPRLEINSVVIELTYHFCTQAKIFNGIYYAPLLRDVPEKSARIENDFSGVPQVGGGSTLLDNSTGFFDVLTDLEWDGGRTKVFLGADQPQFKIEMDFSDYQQIGTWLNDNWKKDNNLFTVENKEIKQQLQYAFPQRVYNTTLYPNLIANAANQPIPLAYGQIFGAAPTCIDSVTKRFKVADHAIASIDEIRIATLTGWQIIGVGTEDLINGEFTVPDWDGTSNLSVDFHGKTNLDGTWMDNASDMVLDFLTFCGQTDFNLASFADSKIKLIIGTRPNPTQFNVLQLLGSADQGSNPPRSGVQTSYNPKLDVVTADFTIEAWIYMPAANTNAGIAGRNRGFTTPWIPMELGFFNGIDTSLQLYLNSVILLTGTQVPTGQWAHVAATRTGSMVTLWINGVSVATATYGAAITYTIPFPPGTPVGIKDTPFRIGSYTDVSGSEYFVGDIKEVKLSKVCRYTSAFTPANILGSDNNTVLYYRLNEGMGSTAFDSSPNGLNGIIEQLGTAALWVTANTYDGVSDRVPSIYLDTSDTIQSVVERINRVVGSYVFVDQNGFFNYVVFEPQQGEGLQEYSILEILGNSFSEISPRESPGILKISIQDILFAYRLSEQWGTTIEDTDPVNQYRKGEKKPVKNPKPNGKTDSNGVLIADLSTFSDADYFTQRLLIFQGRTPKKYQLDAPWKSLLLVPAQQIHVIYPRHSLDKILEVEQVNSKQFMAQVVGNDLHNFRDEVGFWMGDNDVLPTRFANLVGYGNRTDGEPDGSLTWYEAWDPAIKVWARQNAGYWSDDNDFGSSDPMDESSLLNSVWF